MARSIGRTHRLVRLAAVGAALATVALVGGCSAGQEAATSEVVAAVPGGFATATPDASVPLGIVLVEDVVIVYKDSAGYPAGGVAPLSMRIFNQTTNDVTVMPGTVSIVGPKSGTPGVSAGTLSWVSTAPVATPAPAPTPSDSTLPSGSPSTSASPSDSTSATPIPTPAPTPTIPPITIPAGGFVILTPAEAQYLAITGLKAPLMPGAIVALNLVFTSNGKTVTTPVTATFAPPTVPASRAADAPSS